MPVEERKRLALRQQVPAAWGEEAADTLFELLTPAGHELATREDFERGFMQVDQRFAQVAQRFTLLEERMDHRFAAMEEQLDTRFAAMGERFERRISDAVTTQTRTLVLSQLAALVTIAGLAFGLA